jgi:hypothetical protein
MRNLFICAFFIFNLSAYAGERTCSELLGIIVGHNNSSKTALSVGRPALPLESLKYYNSRTTLPDYLSYFFGLYPDDPTHFATAISELPVGSHIIDANAGTGDAMLGILQSGFANVNITAITSDEVVGRSLDFFIKSDEQGKQIQLVTKKTILDLSNEEVVGKFGKAKMIIDVAFYYPENFDVVIKRYLENLDVGGSLYIADRFFDNPVRKGGKLIHFDEWLGSISGVEVVRSSNEGIVDEISRKALPECYEIIKVSEEIHFAH